VIQQVAYEAFDRLAGVALPLDGLLKPGFSFHWPSSLPSNICFGYSAGLSGAYAIA
jgi:hypothetical protein